MTAIAGIFDRAGATVGSEAIGRMGRALAYYGADFSRTATYGSAALACSLGHFVPEDVGRPQPVGDSAGRRAMVFDGRIDNRGEIIGTLGLSPAEGARLSDAALAMRSFERWGVESFTRWVAEFALILWDEADGTMLIARDPFGGRSLFFHDTPQRFYAATMPQGLHALPDIPLELDEQKLADALCQVTTDGERSFFAGISACPSGHYMVIDRDRTRTHRYYDLADHVRDVRLARDQDYVEAARALFGEAVSACLRSSGPVGAFMSGGLDSSTGAIFASDQLAANGKRLPVYTHVPDLDWDGATERHCYGDETPYVESIVRRHPNMILNLVRSQGKTFYHRQDEYLRLSGTPIRGASGMPLFHSVLETAKQDGVRVMLTGNSGNLTLSYRGDGLYYDLWRRGRLLRLFRELRAWDRRPSAMARHFYRDVVGGLRSGGVWQAIEQLRGAGDPDEQWVRHGTARREFGEEMHVPERARESHISYFTRPSGPNRRFARQWVENLGNSASWAPAMKALYRVELRSPFNDRRLIEWCFGVPEEQFRRNGVGKWLIKRMMRGVTPDDVLFKPIAKGRANADRHLNLTRDLDRMKADVAAIAADGDLSRMIDVPRLRQMLEDWPARAPLDDPDGRHFQLGINLPMAMQVARFVQLTKGSNA